MEYTSRVSAITLFAFDGPSWCKIWEELLSVTEHDPVLQKLSSVAFCDITRQAICPGALALISPSVRKLNFSIKGAYSWAPFDERLRSLFSQSFDAAPEIEKLRLEVLPSRLGASLLQVHCYRIHDLEVFPQLNLEDLPALMELPTL